MLMFSFSPCTEPYCCESISIGANLITAIVQFVYDFISLATHSTCTVLGKRSTAVNFSTL